MKIKNQQINLKQIADSGQAFRWYEVTDGYVVVARHKAVMMRQLSDGIEIDDEDSEWGHYFDTSRDYNKIIEHYRGKDDYLDAAMDFGSGIRILNQGTFETVVSFIISANNNIKRITAAMKSLAEHYGTLITVIDDVEYYDFPSPEQLRNVSIEDFRACGVGYRDVYLYELVHDILENRIDLEALKNLSDDELKVGLMRLKGVGEKVAHCIMLFAYGRTEVFPIDTWMKKILEQEYNIKKGYHKFVDSYFDFEKGIAQQYLFFYARHVKIQ